MIKSIALLCILMFLPIQAAAGYTPSDMFDEQCKDLTGFESRMCRRRAHLEYLESVRKDSKRNCYELRGTERRACVRAFTQQKKEGRHSRGVRRNLGIKRVYKQKKAISPTVEQQEHMHELRRYGRRRRVTTKRADLAEKIRLCRENRATESFQDCVRRARDED